MSGPVNGVLYNPVDWDKLMKNPDLDKNEFTRLYALATAARFRSSQVFINHNLRITMKLYDGGETEDSSGRHLGRNGK